MLPFAAGKHRVLSAGLSTADEAEQERRHYFASSRPSGEKMKHFV